MTGGSQGGGITLAAAGLVPEVARWPCRMCLSCATTAAPPSWSIPCPTARSPITCKVHRDKVETVFHTLAYFDGMNFSARAKAPALFSVGLMDTICPPSTVYAAYNHYAGPKQINIYEYNNHEGGGTFQTEAKLKFLQRSGRSKIQKTYRGWIGDEHGIFLGH